ncbi:MAG TPA: hypothetical protein VJT81_14535 [Burkholderiales bacterium]|nr:hypothetical protein [Burkholderiales bacterium]
MGHGLSVGIRTSWYLRAAAWFSLLACVEMAHAGVFSEGDRVMLELGPYVAHWEDNQGHNQWPHLVGAEWESGSHWLVGGAVFKNSYYQDAAYVYGGRRWFLERVNPNLYVKLSAGLVYGYKDPYEDQLPINNKGYGLGIVPAVGYQFGRANAQIVLLGAVAVAFTFGYDFWN